MSRTLRTQLWCGFAERGDDDPPFAVTFAFTTKDPLAIHCTFYRKSPIKWEFSLDLFTAAFRGEAPAVEDGDVTVLLLDNGVLELWLRDSDDGTETALHFNANRVREFVTHASWLATPAAIEAAVERGVRRLRFLP